VKAIVAYEQNMGLAGVFIYSADMDTTDYQVSVTLQPKEERGLFVMIGPLF
jgi:hypothetical protein